MSRYYCLIAGLPVITPDDTKLTYTVSEFKAELKPLLSARDKRLMQWFYLKFDNRNVLSFLRKMSEEHFDDRGNYSNDNIKELYDFLKAEERVPAKNPLPAYFTTFIRSYLARLENETSDDPRLLEDQLSALYYEAAMKCGNEFMSSWFEMNLNIGNVLAVLNCRKYGLNREHFVIGHNELAEQLRTSNARDFHFNNPISYLSELMQISEETDLMMREKRLDLLRWKWLDEQTFFKTFDIESVITYMLQLEMIERWITLDKVRGQQTFRRLVSDMKRESAETLEEFKENNK